MSIHHLSLAGNLPMPAAKKLIFMAICDDASSENGHAFPGMDKLGSWSGLKSKSRILELIAELIDEGYLARVESGHKGRRAVFQVYAQIACCPLHGPILPLSEGSASPDPSLAPVSKGSDQSDATPHKGSDKGSDKGSGPNRTPSLSPISPIEKPRRKSSLPASWSPNENARTRCAAEGLDINHEVDMFKNHHTAKGSMFVSWDAAFVTWLGYAKKWGQPNGQKPRLVPAYVSPPERELPPELPRSAS